MAAAAQPAKSSNAERFIFAQLALIVSEGRCAERRCCFDKVLTPASHRLKPCLHLPQGQHVHVRTKDGSVYAGVFHSSDPRPGGLALTLRFASVEVCAGSCP